MKNRKIFLQELEKTIPAQLSLNQAIIKVLKINKDAASRRIAGKTPFTYSEVCQLAKAYGVHLLPAQSDNLSNVVFSYMSFKNKKGDSKYFYQNISQFFKQINAHKHKHLFHIATEIPVYHYYNYPRLLNFKLFYWGKYLLSMKDYMKTTFSDLPIDANITKYAKESYKEYSKIPSTEIWTPQTIQSVLSQLAFCIEIGDFKQKNDVISVVNELELLMKHIKQMAEENNKAFDFNEKLHVPFQFYKIDVHLNSSSLLAELDEQKIAMQQFNSINFMSTSQPDFCQEAMDWIYNIQSKSSLLSGAGIVERQKFFSSVNKQINEFKDRLEKVEFG